MKVSLNTIKQLAGIDMSLEDLTSKINSQLGAIEAIVELGRKYEDALIVKVVRAEKHPNADRLSVCMIDDDGARQGVERSDDGLVQVVCGAPNVTAGMFAVWLPPNSTVPASFDDKEPFVLSARELRGVVSQGMLAAGDELAINSDHDGIVEVKQIDIAENGPELRPGLGFAETFELDDTIIDIENKMFTHRPDLFGQMGVAREIFAIAQPDPSSTSHNEEWFQEQEWYWRVPVFESATGLGLNVFNDASDVAPRFMAVAMQGITIEPSPLWLQTTLVRWGSKPINNVVDLTNYIMLLTAQPTHAYDYDKLRGHTVGVRMGKQGEKVTLLNGKTYEVTDEDIVIADGEGPVGLAGIMGGGESEVDRSTTSIVLEVATFDMYTVRKSSMRHGVFTDALARFNKGQSYLQNDRVIHRLIQLMGVHASGRQASDVFDRTSILDDNNKESIHGPIRYDATFVNERLGLGLTSTFIGNLLRFGRFASYRPDGGGVTTLETTAPFWRTDIAVPEDIVEEVGRLYGFDRLPRELPRRSIVPARPSVARVRSWRTRQLLSQAGASEVLTYSFVNENVLQKAGQSDRYAYKISNALSPDLAYYRTGLTPSLLDKTHMNHKAGHSSFALFELGTIHFKGEMDMLEPTVPNEESYVAFVVSDEKKNDSMGSPYYAAKRYAAKLINEKQYTLFAMKDFDFEGNERAIQLTAPYEPNRSAVVVKDGEIRGVIGEFKPSVKSAFKLPPYSAGFELHMDIVSEAGREYRPLSRYPATTRDVCFRVEGNVSYGEIIKSVESVIFDEIDVRVEPVDIYQASGDTSRNITVHLTFVPYNSTLSASQVNDVTETITSTVARAVGAEIV